MLVAAEEIDPTKVTPGAGGLVVFIALLVAGYFLYRSLRKQLNRGWRNHLNRSMKGPLELELTTGGQHLDWVIEHHPGWVRPRWERQPRVWSHLLGAALESDTELLTQVSLRGLQLMAAGMLSQGGRGIRSAAL